MSQQLRRGRERAEREQRIVAAARALAEAEGWDAVTTRRLAAEIEYSQPVLYSHFPGGKEAIMTAAALQGFAELAVHLERAAQVATPLVAIAAAYVAFADAKPALYDAMFTLASAMPFGRADTPAALRQAFAALAAAIAPGAAGADVETLTETFWAALHGLVTLARGGRLRPGHRTERLALLVARFGGWAGSDGRDGDESGGETASGEAGSTRGRAGARRRVTRGGRRR